MPITDPRSRTKTTRGNWSWHDQAECRGEDLELFFGPDGERITERENRELEAKALCRVCPVREQCLDHALSQPESSGIFGGKNPDERKLLRRRRARSRAAA